MSSSTVSTWCLAFMFWDRNSTLATFLSHDKTSSHSTINSWASKTCARRVQSRPQRNVCFLQGVNKLLKQPSLTPFLVLRRQSNTMSQGRDLGFGCDQSPLHWSSFSRYLCTKRDAQHSRREANSDFDTAEEAANFTEGFFLSQQWQSLTCSVPPLLSPAV